MFNGDSFRAFTSGANKVWTDKLPGETLWEHLNRGTLTRQIVEAAGHEFRRVHQFWSDKFRSPWPHGDAGMANVVYNERTGRARLIDFEIVHEQVAAGGSAARR